MPSRSKVQLLPDDVKAALDQKLIGGNFSNYQALADWLESQGFELSKSAVHRYGQEFQERLSAVKLATEQARAMVEATPDDEAGLADALTRLVQERLFSVLVKLDTKDTLDPQVLSKLTRAIADINKSVVPLRRYQYEIRTKLKQAADDVEKIATSGGLSNEAADLIRAKILGIGK